MSEVECFAIILLLEWLVCPVFTFLPPTKMTRVPQVWDVYTIQNPRKYDTHPDMSNSLIEEYTKPAYINIVKIWDDYIFRKLLLIWSSSVNDYIKVKSKKRITRKGWPYYKTDYNLQLCISFLSWEYVGRLAPRYKRLFGIYFIKDNSDD